MRYLLVMVFLMKNGDTFTTRGPRFPTLIECQQTGSHLRYPIADAFGAVASVSFECVEIERAV